MEINILTFIATALFILVPTTFWNIRLSAKQHLLNS